MGEEEIQSPPEETPASAEGSPAQAAPEEAAEAADERSLVFLEPSPEERARIEALGEELGRQIWAVDPAEFSLEMLESFGEAGFVVVAWDLGGRPGLDWVESLSRDPQLDGIPIALSIEAPTAGLVRAAWRAGARAVLRRPYEVEEIRARLLAEPPADS